MTSIVSNHVFREAVRAGERHPAGLDLLYLRSTRHLAIPFGSSRRIRILSERALAEEHACRSFSESDLDTELAAARENCRSAGHAPKHLAHTIALVREAARRELGLEAYEVQLQGAIVMLDGAVAEMATGEGKTLAIAIAAVVSAWRSRGCHVMTANDYLAKRDAEWVRPLCKRCAVEVGCVTSYSSDPERKSAYQAGIVYATPREIAADYLRDALESRSHTTRVRALLADASGPRPAASRPRLRHMEVAIIDEADAVLIDEAVTPLIMSNSSDGKHDIAAILAADRLVSALRTAHDYKIDQMQRSAYLTKSGKHAVQNAIHSDQPTGILAMRRFEELVVTAIVAHSHYLEERDYVIQDGQAIIIDQPTGRLMPDRSYRSGLHQAIEAKHNLTPRPPQDSVASISFQKFFAKYDLLSGASGTAKDVSAEFWEIYTQSVHRIPTNRPVARISLPTIRSTSRERKEHAIVHEVCGIIRDGRAVLIGCQSVSTSERIAARLRETVPRCEVLNAFHHAEEARIIAGAGQAGRVTIATNMAGRGTDIKISPEVRSRGGLHVIIAEPLASERLERQLAGRCGRQGEPGSVRKYIAPDDDLFTHSTPRAAKILPGRVLARTSRVAQYFAERTARARRRQVLIDDEKTDELLGFAGAPM